MSVFPEPCTVELCVVLRYMAEGGSQAGGSLKSASQDPYIELSKPVTIQIAPSGEKR